MKSLLVVFWVIAIALLVMLASCETIEVERLVFDTVYVDRPRQSIAPSFITVRDTVVIRDTVSVTVVQHNTIINNIHTVDTVIQVVTKDSLIIQTVEKIVEHRDTIVIHDVDTIVIALHDTTVLTEYVQRVVYLEYQFLYPGQSATFIPPPLQGIVNDFFTRCTDCHGGDLVIEYVDDLPGDNWHSNSFRMSGDQWILQLHTSLIVEHSRSSIYRELARIQRGKKYVTDASKIMCPWFRTSPEPTTNEINQLFQ